MDRNYEKCKYNLFTYREVFLSYINCFQSLGKLGKVLKVYSDGDLRVQLDGHAWTLHPQCVKIIPGSAAELANTMHATQNQRQEPSSE